MYTNRLRDLREDRDLKRKDLAGVLRVHQTTCSDYEPGRTNVKMPYPKNRHSPVLSPVHPFYLKTR